MTVQATQPIVLQNKIMYSTTENTLRIYFTGVSSNNPIFQPNGKIRLSGDFDASESTQASYLNGREFTISSVQYANPHQIILMLTFK